MPGHFGSSVAEHSEMERAIGGLTTWGIRANTHLVGVGQQSDRTNSRIDVLVHRAADNAGEVGLGRTLKLVLPRNGVIADARALALNDPVTAGDRAVRSYDAGQSAFEVRQSSSTLPRALFTFPDGT